MQELADKIASLHKEIENIALQNEEQVENYRIRFLGSKGLVKQLMSEMKHVSSDLKKISAHDSMNLNSLQRPNMKNIKRPKAKA